MPRKRFTTAQIIRKLGEAPADFESPCLGLRVIPGAIRQRGCRAYYGTGPPARSIKVRALAGKYPPDSGILEARAIDATGCGYHLPRSVASLAATPTNGSEATDATAMRRTHDAGDDARIQVGQCRKRPTDRLTTTAGC